MSLNIFFFTPLFAVHFHVSCNVFHFHIQCFYFATAFFSTDCSVMYGIDFHSFDLLWSVGWDAVSCESTLWLPGSIFYNAIAWSQSNFIQLFLCLFLLFPFIHFIFHLIISTELWPLDCISVKWDRNRWSSLFSSCSGLLIVTETLLGFS